MKILITGGLGFIGGRLSIHLSKNGHEVVIGTRRNSDSPTWLPSAKVVVTEWSSVDSLKKACLGVDLVIHAAGMNAKDCALDPEGAFEFNGNATSNLLDAAISSRVKKFFYISSAHVYSNPLQGVIDENSLPINSHPYGTSHLMGEKVVNNARGAGLINSMVLRLSNAYGAPASPEVNCWMLLVNNLCFQAVTTEQLTLAASGTNLRNFITLTDVCTVIGHLIDKSENERLPQIINIGNRHSNTVFEMAELVQSRSKVVLGFSPKIILNSEDFYQNTKVLDFKSLHVNLFKDLITNDRNSEIDKLLIFCKNFFANNSLRIKAK